MTDVEVHDIEISLDGKDEMLRLMAGDQEFARIIVKPMEDGTCVLKVYDVNEDKSEKFLKWVSGISSLITQESLA